MANTVTKIIAVFFFFLLAASADYIFRKKEEVQTTMRYFCIFMDCSALHFSALQDIAHTFRSDEQTTNWLDRAVRS
jgi:hypothetical protein